MLYTSLSSSRDDLFSEVDRLQREFQNFFGGRTAPTSIRSVARGSFPALNVASTSNSFVIYAFAPGLEPSTIDVSIDRGILSISGARTKNVPGASGTVSVYAAERFAGSFDRKLALPDDTDASNVDARYADGVLRITLARRQKAEPKRIDIQ